MDRRSDLQGQLQRAGLGVRLLASAMIFDTNISSCTATAVWARTWKQESCYDQGTPYVGNVPCTYIQYIGGSTWLKRTRKLAPSAYRPIGGEEARARPCRRAQHSRIAQCPPCLTKAGAFRYQSPQRPVTTAKRHDDSELDPAQIPRFWTMPSRTPPCPRYRGPALARHAHMYSTIEYGRVLTLTLRFQQPHVRERGKVRLPAVTALSPELPCEKCTLSSHQYIYPAKTTCIPRPTSEAHVLTHPRQHVSRNTLRSRYSTHSPPFRSSNLTAFAEVATTLSQLKLSAKSPQKPANKPKSAPVAESWDEDVSASGSDTETEEPSDAPSSRAKKDRDSLSPLATITSADTPNPPPPTPASPTGVPFDFPDNVPYGAVGGGNSRDGSRRGSGAASPARRPDKTTAVAGRLIAGALGVRAPRRTEEEREYDRAMRDKERKRRDEEREREKQERQAAEDRKRSVWED